jgi:nitrite reductase/ring-hydroxylating ferredoxin subunit
MRHSFLVTIFSLFVLIASSCSSDNNVGRNNPYIPNYSFSIEINMNLPMYNSLQYPSNGVLVTTNGVGANGIIVFNAGGTYRAYEANCPNQYISACSRLEIDGIKAVCPCDNLEYSLFTGLPMAEGEYPMKPYRIEQIGSVLRVFN